MPSDLLLDELVVGLKGYGLVCTEVQLNQLIEFIQLLEKWNKAYNLTAIKDPLNILRLHILDSLSIAQYLQGKTFIDVGTGPGFPGIPLAIVFPERNFTLLDSNGKKVRFLFQAKNQLQLRNVVEIQSRVESYRPEKLFDGVTSRAYSSIEKMLSSCRHLVRENGHFYAMKGLYPEQELSEMPKNYKVFAFHPLQVPGVDGNRHLIDLIAR